MAETKELTAAELFEQIKTNAARSGRVNLYDAVGALAAKAGEATTILGFDLKKEILGLGANLTGILKSGGQESGAGLANAFKKATPLIINAIELAAKAGLTDIAGIVGTVKDMILLTVIKTNQLWQGMWGGVTASMNTMVSGIVEAAGLQGTLGGQALSGMMQNVITALAFQFKDALAYRKSRIAEEAQTGTGRGGVVAKEAMGYTWALGRDKALDWSRAMSGQGVTQEKGITGQALRVGLSQGMEAGDTAKMMGQYISLTGNANTAIKQMDASFRKVQEAAAGTNLPVKEMVGFINQAAAQARFLNVDVGTVQNTMATLMKDSKELSKFGIDIRTQGGDIAKELAGGGQGGISDAMYMYFGSARGTKDTGMDAWAKGRFGTGAATFRETAGGGFDLGASVDEMKKGGGEEMVNRLKIMKQVMMDAAASGTTVAEKLYLQQKAARDVFGLSEATALTLAKKGESEVGTMAEDKKLANEMKSTNQLLGELQEWSAKDEQIQRALSAIAIEELGLTMQSVSYFKALGLIASGGKNTAKGLEMLENAQSETRASFDDIFGEGKKIGTVLRSAFVGSGNKDLLDKFDGFVNRVSVTLGGVSRATKDVGEDSKGNKTSKAEENKTPEEKQGHPFPPEGKEYEAQGGPFYGLAEGGRLPGANMPALPSFRVNEFAKEFAYFNDDPGRMYALKPGVIDNTKQFTDMFKSILPETKTPPNFNISLNTPPSPTGNILPDMSNNLSNKYLEIIANNMSSKTPTESKGETNMSFNINISSNNGDSKDLVNAVIDGIKSQMRQELG